MNPPAEKPSTITRSAARCCWTTCRISVMSSFVSPRRTGRLEPVPATTDIVASSLSGIENEEVSPLGDFVEPGAEREVLRCLPAAVEGNDQRDPGALGLWRVRRHGECAGNVEPVQACSETALLECPLAGILLVRGDRDAGTAKGDRQSQRDQGPTAQLGARSAF